MTVGQRCAVVRAEINTAALVVHRDLLRLRDEHVWIIVSLLQPLLFLLALGWGLAPITNFGRGLSVPEYMFPGALVMSVLLPAYTSASTIIWDREHGMLREMLVAPVSRRALVVGKCLGGAAVATTKGIIMVCLAGLVGVPYHPLMICAVLVQLFLLAFTVASFGVFMASRIVRQKTFTVIASALIMPLFALSGATFPVSELPSQLEAINHIDPLTYGVDPIRHTVLSQLDMSMGQRAQFDPGITLAGQRVSVWWELAVEIAIAVIFVGLATSTFRTTEE